ncbi:MAG: hypothetical protein Q9216_002250 [Gyalolechia sp. 2 TL-2023]
MTSSQTKQVTHCAFLSLPPEIRQLIYDELLVLRPDQDHLLYHDRSGGNRSLPVHPHILRVNKQINTEATSALYGRNMFQLSLSTPVMKQCSGSFYPRRFGKKVVLPRNDSDAQFIRYDQGQGFMYPHCFQRLAYIEITIGASSIWGNSGTGVYFSHIGDLVLELLRLLAEESVDEAPQRTKRLVLIVEKYHSKYYPHKALFPRRIKNQEFMAWAAVVNGEKQLADQVVPLLEAVNQKRHLTIIEVVKRDPDGELDAGEGWEIEDGLSVTRREVKLTDVAEL